MKIGYARVSTTNQDLENQLKLLHEEGCEKIYKEKVSGASTSQRLELKLMIEHVRAGDVIYVSKIDRLARSIIDLNKIVQLLNEKAVSIRFVKDNLYFEAGNSNSMNTLIFNMLGSFAQFERDLIVERTSEGRERAKKHGKHMGRKPSSSKKEIEKAIALYQNRNVNEMSVSDILKLTGVKKSTFYYELKNKTNKI